MKLATGTASSAAHRCRAEQRRRDQLTSQERRPEQESGRASAAQEHISTAPRAKGHKSSKSTSEARSTRAFIIIFFSSRSEQLQMPPKHTLLPHIYSAQSTTSSETDSQRRHSSQPDTYRHASGSDPSRGDSSVFCVVRSTSERRTENGRYVMASLLT